MNSEVSPKENDNSPRMEPIQVLSSLYENLSGAKWDKRKFSLEVIAATWLHEPNREQELKLAREQ